MSGDLKLGSTPPHEGGTRNEDCAVAALHRLSAALAIGGFSVVCNLVYISSSSRLKNRPLTSPALLAPGFFTPSFQPLVYRQAQIELHRGRRWRRSASSVRRAAPVSVSTSWNPSCALKLSSKRTAPHAVKSGASCNGPYL